MCVQAEQFTVSGNWRRARPFIIVCVCVLSQVSRKGSRDVADHMAIQMDDSDSITVSEQSEPSAECWQNMYKLLNFYSLISDPTGILEKSSPENCLTGGPARLSSSRPAPHFHSPPPPLWIQSAPCLPPTLFPLSILFFSPLPFQFSPDLDRHIHHTLTLLNYTLPSAL